jgi:DNA-binding phage protein
MISKLKNKFIVQNDDDYKLFSLKNEEDCDRFLDILFNNNPRKNLIIVKDISTIHRKYLYEILEEKGFTRKQLYTSFTTYPK